MSYAISNERGEDGERDSGKTHACVACGKRGFRTAGTECATSCASYCSSENEMLEAQRYREKENGRCTHPKDVVPIRRHRDSSEGGSKKEKLCSLVSVSALFDDPNGFCQ